MSQIRIAVMSNSGGSGKTTLTIHLGYELARRGCSVALLDLDSNRSLALFCGLDDPPSEKSMAVVLSDSFTDWPLFTCWEGSTGKGKVEACLGGVYMAEVGKELVVHPRGVDLLRYALTDEEDGQPLPHDVVLLDCPANLGIFNEIALASCTHILIPIKPSPKDENGAGALIDWITSKCRILRLKPKPEYLGVVLNNVGKNANAKSSEQELPKILSSLDIPFYESIHHYVTIENATEFGKPIHLYRPGHAATKQFKPIVNAIEKLLKKDS